MANKLAIFDLSAIDDDALMLCDHLKGLGSPTKAKTTIELATATTSQTNKLAILNLSAIDDDDLMLCDHLKDLGCITKGNTIAPAAPLASQKPAKIQNLSPGKAIDTCAAGKATETSGAGGDMSFITQGGPLDLWAEDYDLLSGILPSRGNTKVRDGVVWQVNDPGSLSTSDTLLQPGHTVQP
jgi:hypothetical protein